MWLPVAVAVAAQEATAPPQGLPGSPATPEVISEIQQTLDAAVARFDAMDTAALLAHVSAQYRTGDLTKAGIAAQLKAFFALHDRVTARVRIDDVRMVGDVAWVYSTGEVIGRPRLMRRSFPVLWWERELEVARRENGRWLLYGYQQ
jgi:hypothetical protein